MRQNQPHRTWLSMVELLTRISAILEHLYDSEDALVRTGGDQVDSESVAERVGRSITFVVDGNSPSPRPFYTPPYVVLCHSEF